MFPLDLPLGTVAPALAKYRGTPRHTILHRPGTAGFDDVYDNFYPQASSQWDSLAHVGYAPDEFFNGATEADIQSGRRNSIDHWARHGIAGRAVLLDIPRAMASSGRDYHPGSSTALGVEELELARQVVGLQYAIGDIVLLHTGFMAWYRDQQADVRERLHGSVIAPGIAHAEEICEYLWDIRAAAIASDTYGVEVWPNDPLPDAQPVGFSAPHAHRSVRNGPRRAVVAERPGRRLCNRRHIRKPPSQFSAKCARRHRLARQRDSYQVR